MPLGPHAGMLVHEDEPFNAEPRPADLAATAITPAEHFYVRSHGAVPHPDPRSWRLHIAGQTSQPLVLTLKALCDGHFDEHEVLATLQCAGNRRAEMIAVRDIPGEAPWGPGATGTATWRGVRLMDVLAAAGVGPAVEHVAFVGVDRSEEAEPPQAFGASIPLRKALTPEVLLAHAMNGEPLAPSHGAPLRVVVPGYIGARSVKWVERIELRSEPWDGYFQDTAYRLLAANQSPGPGIGTALGEVSLNTAILVPEEGSRITAGLVELRGYASTGAGHGISRVEVSADGGRSWVRAELLEDQGPWAWRRWRANLELATGERELLATAWDGAAGSQPEQAETVWNPKGYANTSWARVHVVVDG